MSKIHVTAYIVIALIFLLSLLLGPLGGIFSPLFFIVISVLLLMTLKSCIMRILEFKYYFSKNEIGETLIVFLALFVLFVIVGLSYSYLPLGDLSRMNCESYGRYDELQRCF